MTPFAVDWSSLLRPTLSVVEILIRGSAIYLGLFFALRVFHNRASGQLGIGDLLLITLLADVVGNAVTSESRSLTEGFLFAATIFFWTWFLDWLAFRFPGLRRFIQSGAREVVRAGRVLPRAMRKELLTEDELMSYLRKQGHEDLSGVDRVLVEPDGSLSVICRAKRDA